MQNFFYRAKSSRGTLREGILKAPTLQAASAALIDTGLQPIELHPATKTELERYKVEPNPPKKTPRRPSAVALYHPLLDTLRLYAGWLLAWYILVYALGSYQEIRDLPVRIPFVQALLPAYSPVVLSFALACFLFLLLSTMHKHFGGGRQRALLFTVIGCTVFALYRMNV